MKIVGEVWWINIIVRKMIKLWNIYNVKFENFKYKDLKILYKGKVEFLFEKINIFVCICCVMFKWFEVNWLYIIFYLKSIIKFFKCWV